MNFNELVSCAEQNIASVDTTQINHEFTLERRVHSHVSHLQHLLLGSETAGFFLNMLPKACFRKVLIDYQDLGRNLAQFNTNHERLVE